MTRLTLFAVSMLAVMLGCSPGGSMTLPDGGSGAGGAGGNGGGGGGPPADAQKSTVVVSPSRPLLADQTDMGQVTVTVNDANGKPLQNQNVSIALSLDGGQVGQAMLTDANGVVTLSIDSPTAGVATVTATVHQTPPVILAATPSVTFIAGPATGYFFSVQPPLTVKAGETITPAPQLTWTDAHNNPTSGPALPVALRLVWDDSNGTLTGGTTGVLVDGGIVFNALSVDRPQVGYALRAEVTTGPAAGAADESQMFNVVIGDAAMETSTVLGQPVNVVADGTSTTALTVTLEDIAGNPVGGQAIVLSVSGTGNLLAADGGTSDGAGVFATTLASTVAEMKTVTATVGAVQLTTHVTFIQ